MNHSTAKATLIKRALLVLCPLVLLFAIKEAVELARFGAFLDGIHETTTPLNERILLSHGATLLIKGAKECGGLQGDCGASARIRIQWNNGAIETVENPAQLREGETSEPRLFRWKGRWKLQVGYSKWERVQKDLWTRNDSG